VEFGDVDRMYLRNYLRDGQRHLEAASILFENGYYDYAVKEAHESMLWNVDALLLTTGIITFKNSTAIAWFGKKFVKEDIYPPEFYEHLLLANASYKIANSEFAATITRDEAFDILDYSRKFTEIVAYLKEFTVEKKREGEENDDGQTNGPGKDSK